MLDKVKESQDKESIEVVKSVIGYLDDTRDEASLLNKLEVSSFAEQAGEIILGGLDNIKTKLIELAKQHKFNALSTDIKHSMQHPNTRISSIL